MNHGDPSNFPQLDIFGDKRPRGRRPDAGAVERVSALTLFAALLLASRAEPASLRSQLYIAPYGSDDASCTSTAPCRSFEHVYGVAQGGRQVIVEGGAYGRQMITRVGRAASAGTVRFVASGSRPRVSSLIVLGSHVEFDGLSFSEWKTLDPADHVTFRNDSEGRFTIASATNVSVIGGSAGPFQDSSNNIAPVDATTTKAPQNILIDGVRFHDYTKASPTAHVDCLHSWGVDGLTIRNSRFSNCEHFDILLDQTGNAGLPRNVTIENNFLDCCRTGYFSVYLGNSGGQAWSNILVRNNSSNKDMGIDPNNITGTNIRFLANIAPTFQGCGRTGVTADYNIWYSGTRCGRRDAVLHPQFVNARRGDFRLRASSPAIDRGDPHNFPRRDIHGRRRPRGRSPDAGAVERR